ncbi:MAG: Fe-S cluster assembly ATPase SufC [Candidatus Peribacteraceae bacterium]|nr:Fe-S cluster assembly ATPase SufC [Candidatus Peribacteraceae bacterium]
MPKKTTAPLLSIRNLRVAVREKEILRGLSLTIRSGEIHAIMGPNGSGKSTLASTLMGHPAYAVTGGGAALHGSNLLDLAPDERARRGLFLAFQYPRELKGVSLRSFLHAAYEAQMHDRDPEHKKLSPLRFASMLTGVMRLLQMDPAFADRSVNEGFSGGERKKAEVLQLNILRPELALLDETDSGLDVDALKIVADGVNRMRGPAFSAIIVTHYARLLEYIVPDHVHVMIRGKIVESGGAALAHRLEKEGYAKYGVKERIALDEG